MSVDTDINDILQCLGICKDLIDFQYIIKLK